MRIEASRPHMPGYQLLAANEGSGLLPWSWAEERLDRSHNYWLATVGASGAPHAMAVWGVWQGGAFFFSTNERSRKARNLAREPRCSLTTESAAEAVVAEGEARRLDDATLAAEIAALYAAKYGEEPPPPLFRFEPAAVFGFIEDAAEFVSSATRWRIVR